MKAIKNTLTSDDNGSINNAATALLLLREWLSVSESQLCSTEVLSEQLPKVNQLLEDSMNEISERFSHLSSNMQKIQDEVNYIDETLDTVKIKGYAVEIPDHLEKLASKTEDETTAKYLKEAADKIRSQENKLHKELGKATSAIQENFNEISQIVVGMQFQDRVSQNILITVNVMQEIISFLDAQILTAMPDITKEDRKKMLNKDFAKDLIKTFRLGELQLSFVRHLIEHGYIEDAAEVGFDLSAHEVGDKKDDDIDLF